MALFDLKNFNGEVFGKYVETAPNLNRDELIKSGAIVQKQEYASMLPAQTGGNFISIPIKARIGGGTVNYDGNTNITAVSRDTFTQGRVVVGRAQGWTEKDFSTDITGEDFLPAAQEIADFWQDVDQATLLATMKGIFSMSNAEEFTEGHTYDISDEATPTFGATTLNTAMQKALGDNKAKFALAIMHSAIATGLENLDLIEYLKYTDKNGVQRDLALGTINGRLVLIDDGMPVLNGYDSAESTTPGSLKVVASGASTGEINLADVQKGDFYPSGVAADDYVVAGEKFVTYVLAQGAIEYTNVGAKVPYEMDRDPAVNGGETTLYSRQRKIFSPYGISWIGNQMSPTDAQLATGSNWEIANDNQSEGTVYFPVKAIGIARIISRSAF